MLKIMRAISVKQFGGPEVLTIAEVPVPTIGDNELLVHIKATGVNPVETYIRSGSFALKPPLPYIPGKDGAGIVKNIGKNVTKYKVGDRVIVTQGKGTYAEYCAVRELDTLPLPDKLTFAQGAAIGIPYFTAAKALFENMHVKPGETLLIHGASGGVGLAATQMARNAGLTVIGTAGTEDGIRVVQQAGAHIVYNHRDPDYVKKIGPYNPMTNTGGVDAILENLANVNWEKDIQLLKLDGRCTVVGARGIIQDNNPMMFILKNVHFSGTANTGTDEDWKRRGAYISAGLQNGWLVPIVDREYKLDEAPTAHKDIIESSGAKGKLVLIP